MEEKKVRGGLINQAPAFIFLFMILALCLPGQEDLAKLLPAEGEVPGWHPSRKPETAAGDDLFKLIDGGAELYHEYGFSSALNCIFRHSNGSEINIEIYQMNDAAAAYGVYSFKLGFTGRQVDAGQEATLDTYYLNMWKGNFLVTLTGLDQKEQTISGLLPLASAIAARITDTGKRPQLLDAISGWMEEKPRMIYLKGRLALINHYPDLAGDLLSFREGIMARYTGFDLLLLRYGSESESRKAFSRWATSLSRSFDIPTLPEVENRITFKDRNDKQMKAEYFGKYIGIITHTASRLPDVNLDSLKQLVKMLTPVV